MFAFFSKHLSSSWMQLHTVCHPSHATTLLHQHTINCYTIERCRLNPVDDDQICMQLRFRLCMRFKGLMLRTDFQLKRFLHHEEGGLFIHITRFDGNSWGCASVS